MTPFHFRGGFVIALALTLSAPAIISLSGCSQAEQKEAAADTSTAYSDFKMYVEGVERDASRLDFSDTEFSEEMNRVKADYDAKLALAEQDAEKFTAEEKADIAALQIRYTTAFEQRQAAYRTRVPATVPVGGTYKPLAAGYATLAAADLRATYEQFVQNAKANEDRYGIEEWRAVNADWQALNDRKNQVEKELSMADQAEIAKEKIKYAAIKTVDKTQARVSQGATATKDGAYETGEAFGRGVSKTGQAIGDGASKAGQAIDKGAEKVGSNVKSAYKGARDAVRAENAAAEEAAERAAKK